MDFGNLLGVESLRVALIAAAVSSIVSFLTVLVTVPLKYLLDARLHERNLELDHRQAQRRKLKKKITRWRGSLIHASEAMTRRLWRLPSLGDRRMLQFPAGFVGDTAYFPRTFAYRILLTIAVAQRIDREALTVDLSVTGREDLEFLKAVRLLLMVWSTPSLFDGLEYDSAEATDHVFKGDLAHMADQMYTNDKPMSEEAFRRKIQEAHSFSPLFRLLQGLHADEERLRYDRLVAVHLINMAFLTQFGYDFHSSPATDFEDVCRRCRHPEVLRNLSRHISSMALDKSREYGRLLQLIEVVESGRQPKRSFFRRRS